MWTDHLNAQTFGTVWNMQASDLTYQNCKTEWITGSQILRLVQMSFFFCFKLTINIAIFLSFQKQTKVKIYLANTYKYIIYHTQFTYGVAAP